MRPLSILWQRLVSEGATCPRCASTERNIVSAVARLRAALGPLGIEPVLRVQALDDTAFRAMPSESNRIWIGGRPVEDWLGARAGSSPCCEVCGDLPCRTMEVDGITYEAIPEEVVVRAGVVAASRMMGTQAPHEEEGVVKHAVETTADGVTIRVEVPARQQATLLEEFAKCAAGTCTCPTPQYEKLQSIEVDAQPAGVTVRLKTKPGEHVDVADIEKCLDHTTRQASA